MLRSWRHQIISIITNFGFSQLLPMPDCMALVASGMLYTLQYEKATAAVRSSVSSLIRGHGRNVKRFILSSSNSELQLLAKSNRYGVVRGTLCGGSCCGHL